MSITIGTILSDYIFGGAVSGTSNDILKRAWQKLTKKSWGTLYLDAFQKAVVEERPNLLRYAATDGEISVDRDALHNLLTMNLNISPDTAEYIKLVSGDFVGQLAKVMSEHSVLIIGGHNLSIDGYKYLVEKTVIQAINIFRDSIRSNEDEFKRMVQEVSEQTLSSVIEIRKVQNEISVGLQSGFTKVNKRLDVQTDLLENIHDDVSDIKRLVNRKTQAQVQNGKKNIRIAILAPQDVSDERRISIQVCERLMLDPLLNELISLELIGQPKQGESVPNLLSYNNQRGDGSEIIDQADILVAIFWSSISFDSFSEFPVTEWITQKMTDRKLGTQKPHIMIYRRTERLKLDPDDDGFYDKVTGYDQLKEFFEKIQQTSKGKGDNYNNYDAPSEFGNLLENHLRRVIAWILKEDSQNNPETKEKRIVPRPVWDESPFPGLRSFKPKDAPIFYGRDKEIDDVVRKINENCIVFITGASGSGKSSLVWAGVIPRLQEKYLSIRFTPAEQINNPFLSLTYQILPYLVDFDSSPEGLADDLSKSPKVLSELCMSIKEAYGKEILLFVDQFEELYTTVAPAVKDKFVEFLIEYNSESSGRIIITARSDFYHRIIQYPAFAEMIQKGQYTLSTPRTSNLYYMITKPSNLVGLNIEEGLVEQILQDTGEESGALALLAYTLDELYQRCKQNNVMTYANYFDLGGVRGAIGKRAENVYAGLAPKSKEALIQEIFRELIEVDDRGVATRRRAQLSDFGESLSKQNIINTFIDARLLTTDGAGESAIVMLAHEALLQSWPRLKEWIENTHDDLRLLRQVKVSSREWDTNGRNPGFLWPDERLQFVYKMLERLQPDLNNIEKEFIVPEGKRLLAELENLDATHRRRSWIGDRLSSIGDPRHGVRNIKYTTDLKGTEKVIELPDLQWCEVPGGFIVLEDNAGEFSVNRFFITKYPVTFEQYQTFIDDNTGFDKIEWWQDFPRNFQKQKVSPQNALYSNYPRDNVTWYQAVAFTRWLSKNLPLAGWPTIGGKSAKEFGWIIRLPTEWEWQLAAIGPEAEREYPWGEWHDKYANTSEAGLNRTTAVGMYPSGHSPFGVVDMAGNVREWCLNEYNKPQSVEINSNRRALRGGMFSKDRYFARAAYRSVNVPNSASNEDGFRILCIASDKLGGK